MSTLWLPVAAITLGSEGENMREYNERGRTLPHFDPRAAPLQELKIKKVNCHSKV